MEMHESVRAAMVWVLSCPGRCCSCRGWAPQLLTGAAADNTSAASERVVAIAVLSQLVRSAVVLDRTARALALCSLMPKLSYSSEACVHALAFRNSLGDITEKF